MLLSKVETFQGLEEKACLGEVGHVVLNLISGVMLPKEQTAAEGLQGRSVCVCVCWGGRWGLQLRIMEPLI